MATASSILACEIPWTEEPGGRATVQMVTKSQEDSVTKHTFYAKTTLFWFLYLCNMF